MNLGIDFKGGLNFEVKSNLTTNQLNEYFDFIDSDREVLIKREVSSDVFSIRMSHHAQGNFTAANDPTYSLKVGFISTATYNHTTAAWDETTPCVTCDFTPTDIGLNGGLIQWEGDTERPGIDESNLWKDIEIIFDFFPSDQMCVGLITLIFS